MVTAINTIFDLLQNGRIRLNTIHRESNGTDHTYIDQDLRVTATPEHRAMKLTVGLDDPAHNPGQISWNDKDKTINVDTEVADVRLQLGQEMYIRGTNKTGDVLYNAEAVYIDGAQGQRPTFAKAKADTPPTANCTIAIMTHDLANNGTGYATTFGLVRGIKTNYPTWAEGDILYLSDTVAGGLRNTPPVSPSCKVKIGYVLYVHSAEGVIFVSIQTGFRTSDLQNVSDTLASVTGQYLKWNNATGLFELSLFANDVAEIANTINIATESSGKSLSVSEINGGVIESTGNNTFVLPNATLLNIGNNITLKAMDANAITIDPFDVNDEIYMDGVTTGGGKYIASDGSIGADITLYLSDNSASGKWRVLNRNKTWSLEL